MGKVAVSFEDGRSPVKLVCEPYTTSFDATKTSLMIGCLGGLGRSLTKWMVSRGARKFVFLGRSGSAKSEAQRLADEFIAKGANVVVIQGDVSQPKDVQKAIVAAATPIGGPWATLSNESWHTSVQPKVQGTWNVHNALRIEGRDNKLDFFLMTSSICGTAGTAAEANYCAANAFQDAFASHLLTGVELAGLKQQREKGFDGDNHRSVVNLGTKPRFTEELQFPPGIVEALSGQSPSTLFEAVTAMVRLGDFGLDSMLASEFRNFVYHCLEVDVPFMTLLDKETTVGTIALLITQGLEMKMEMEDSASIDARGS
ncbi:hypothetical protein CC80DRAFT_583724 [Byssothecium circinans]|uniref:Ketoreductase domain-containing protein n=1 Tax=Byssothecium circinans TaxID=147558 RepID=A0A6A5T6R8_9PLEO|nr:hypothetical protein CC80DRAFT_583724 [Byssothecium circinans]